MIALVTQKRRNLKNVAKLIWCLIIVKNFVQIFYSVTRTRFICLFGLTKSFFPEHIRSFIN